MMPEPLEVDKKTGLVKVPRYPCLIGQGLCLLRRMDYPAFYCTNKTVVYCAFRISQKLDDTPLNP